MILLLLALAGQAESPAPQPAEVIAEVRVHGNAAIAEDEVLRLADLQVGAPFTADTTASVEKRLRATGKFRNVEVLKRFASIADASKIVLVIVVDEGDVKIEWDQDSGTPPRTVRRRGVPLMFLPVLSVEDGYGWTYGVRFGLQNPVGPHSRVTFPLTWGADKRAAAQLEKDFVSGPVDRVTTVVSISRREHPFYEQDDDRVRLAVRAERDLLAPLRAGATVGTEEVQFLAVDTRMLQTGADLVLDTRTDPVLARNAVYARAAWDRYALSGSDAYRQYSGPARVRRVRRSERRRQPVLPERVGQRPAAVPEADPRRHGQSSRVQDGNRRGRHADRRLRGSADADYVAVERGQARRERVL